jgi:hypothetical protein
MGVHKIVEQIGKVDPKNWVKIITPKKWLIMTLNWKCYRHPPIAPSNLGVSLTSLERHEPLLHTHHKSLHQIDEEKNVPQNYP